MITATKKSITITLTLFSFTASLRPNTTEQSFNKIYTSNHWKSPESASGTGSTLAQTQIIRETIPLLLKKYNIQSMIDAACGDCNWMDTVNLGNTSYTGVEIVHDLVLKNSIKFKSHHRTFIHANIIEEVLPKTDLILCRDCLVHLSYDQCLSVLKNFKKSGAKYLLITTFTKRKSNANLSNHFGWRPLNMQIIPFNFPRPLEIINEQCTEGNGVHSDKSLGLWLLSDIQLPHETRTNIKKTISTSSKQNASRAIASSKGVRK